MGSHAEKIVTYRRKPLTKEQVARIDALKDVPDEKIDFSDIPDAADDALARTRRGTMYRMLKRQTTLRIDADILEWFKSRAKNGRGYQTDINAALRAYVDAQSKTRKVRKAG